MFSAFKFICKEEPDDDGNDFMEGFSHILKLWVLLSELHFILFYFDFANLCLEGLRVWFMYKWE